jgi:hypothetical protein
VSVEYATDRSDIDDGFSEKSPMDNTDDESANVISDVVPNILHEPLIILKETRVSQGL